MKKTRPCVKCGNKDIKIWDCGYSSFNVGGAKCKCGNKIRLDICDCFPREDIIKSWNNRNPIPEKYIAKIEKEIIKMKSIILNKRKEIKELKKLWKLNV